MGLGRGREKYYKDAGSNFWGSWIYAHYFFLFQYYYLSKSLKEVMFAISQNQSWLCSGQDLYVFITEVKNEKIYMIPSVVSHAKEKKKIQNFFLGICGNIHGSFSFPEVEESNSLLPLPAFIEHLLYAKHHIGRNIYVLALVTHKNFKIVRVTEV